MVKFNTSRGREMPVYLYKWENHLHTHKTYNQESKPGQMGEGGIPNPSGPSLLFFGNLLAGYLYFHSFNGVKFGNNVHGVLVWSLEFGNAKSSIFYSDNFLGSTPNRSCLFPRRSLGPNRQSKENLCWFTKILNYENL